MVSDRPPFSLQSQPSQPRPVLKQHFIINQALLLNTGKGAAPILQSKNNAFHSLKVRAAKLEKVCPQVVPLLGSDLFKTCRPHTCPSLSAAITRAKGVPPPCLQRHALHSQHRRRYDCGVYKSLSFYHCFLNPSFYSGQNRFDTLTGPFFEKDSNCQKNIIHTKWKPISANFSLSSNNKFE